MKDVPSPLPARLFKDDEVGTEVLLLARDSLADGEISLEEFAHIVSITKGGLEHQAVAEGGSEHETITEGGSEHQDHEL